MEDKLTVTVDFNNLKDDEKKQLMDLLEKGREKERCKDFDINNNDSYYFIATGGEILTSQYMSCFNANKKIFGNASKNKSYMEKRAREIKLYNLLSNFAWELYNGEAFTEEEWKDDNIPKFVTAYSYYKNEYIPLYSFYSIYLNDVCFRTEQDAQRAINEVILPFERGEL